MPPSSSLQYVGPYSPQAYNAANINAQGDQATPYNSNIINAGYAIGNAIAGGDVNGAATGGGTGVNPADIAYLDDQANQLRSLLGRTDTNLQQGLTQNQDQYDTQVGGATTDKERQVVSQNKSKLGAYDQIRNNANTGYRSLAQIIGRSAGTGSSAFRELLPNVVGTDTSSKTRNAAETYGTNLSNIDTSFASVLDDLAKQKKQNEENLRAGIETQRQSLNDKLGTVLGQKAQAQGGGYAAVKAAQAPTQAAIENSRNAVEGFFNQYRTPYVAKAIDPNLQAYTTDRATINAQGQPGVDSTNPYASLLRKKLQGA